MTWRSYGRRYLLTEVGTVSALRASLIPAPSPNPRPHPAPALNRGEEARNPMGRRGQECPDVVHDVSRRGGLLYNPPDNERDSGIPQDGLQIHVASHGRPDVSLVAREPMLARADCLAK